MNELSDDELKVFFKRNNILKKEQEVMIKVRQRKLSYYERNKEKRVAYQFEYNKQIREKGYYTRNCDKPDYLEKVEKKRIADKEFQKIYQKEYRKRNKEKLKKYNTEYVREWRRKKKEML